MIRARVRRERMSSRVRAISYLTAKTASAFKYGRPAISCSPKLGFSAIISLINDASVPNRAARCIALFALVFGVDVVAPINLRFLVLHFADFCSCVSASSIVSCAIFRYVVNLPPAMVITPDFDFETLWRRDKSAVRELIFSPFTLFTSGRRPDQTAVTSSAEMFVITAAFSALRT